MARTFRNSYTLRAGIVIAGLLLAGGFISAGHALRKLLSYTRIEKEGIRQVQFLQKEKFQRWDELVGAELRDWKTLKAKTSEELGMTTNVTLEFKEGGRWREYVTFSNDLFSDADFQRFQEWLNANLTMEPSEPSPWQKRTGNTQAP